MNNKEIIEKLNQNLSYLHERKDYLFNQIQQMEQNLENLTEEIHEQERFIELENHKEIQESNIFKLYDTTNKYVEERKILVSKLAGMNVEKERFETLLVALKQEFDQVNENIISIQVLVRNFSEKQSQEGMGITVVNAVKEMESDGKKMPSDIIDRLKLCMGILDLDKERCRMELQNLIQELGE